MGNIDSVGSGFNIINKAYIDNIQPMSMNAYSENFEYNALEIEKAIVENVSEKLEDIIKCVEKCISVNKVFNIALACQMGLGKTFTMEEFSLYCKKKGIKVLYISGINLLGFQQLSNKTIVDTKTGAVVELKKQRHIIAGDKGSVDFSNLDADVIISNMNNAIKSISLLKKNKVDNIIVLDEAHMLRMDYILKNSNLNDEEVSQVMAMMDKLLNEVKESGNKYYTKGVFWLSATFEVFSYDDSIEFTKMYQLESTVDKKIGVELYEPVVVPNFTDKQVLWSVIELLRKNESGRGQQVVYLNNVEQIKRVIKQLKEYKNKTGAFENIDFVNGVAWVSAKNVENNLVYNHIKDFEEIPDYVQLLFVTSLVTAGVNINNKTRSIDLLICCTEDSFNLLNEIQIIGRFRYGIRLLTTLSTSASRKTAMKYKTFLEKHKRNRVEYAQNMIKVLNDNKDLDTPDRKLKELKIYRNKKVGNIFNCINVEDNKFVLSDNALIGMLFSIYQKQEILSSSKALANAFYHHTALNIKRVSEVKEKDYSLEDDCKVSKGSNLIEDSSLDDKPISTLDVNTEVISNVADTKKNKSKELIKVILGLKKIEDVSRRTQSEYYTLKNEDKVKFDLMTSLLDGSKEDKAVIDKYFDLKCTKKELEKCLEDKIIAKSMSSIDKTDLENVTKVVEAFATSNQKIKTVYYARNVLKDIVASKDKEINKIRLNYGDIEYFYNSLLDSNALFGECVEYIEYADENGILRKRKKRFEEYSLDKKPNQSLSDRDVLVVKLKEEVFNFVATFKNIKDKPTELRLSKLKY